MPTSHSLVQELRRQLSKLKLDKESLELNLMAVIEALQKDIKSLEDKRGLDQEEIQRFKVSAAELQQRVWSFQQENGTLKHQLGHQQVEMQKHIESLQNELMAARQQPQVRGVVTKDIVRYSTSCTPGQVWCGQEVCWEFTVMSNHIAGLVWYGQVCVCQRGKV